jgi:hypothetical protein
MPSIEPAMTGRPSSLVAFGDSDPHTASRSNWRSKYNGAVWSHPVLPFAHGFNVLTVAIEKVSALIGIFLVPVEIATP